MSAMQDYSIEQEAIDQDERMFKKFHAVYDDADHLLSTTYKGKPAEIRQAFEYGFEMGLRQGRCLGLQEAMQIIKQKRG